MRVEAFVTPGARKERVVVRRPGTLEITVREKAERNEANTRVRQIVADTCAVPPSRVRMMSGARSHKKVFIIDV